MSTPPGDGLSLRPRLADQDESLLTGTSLLTLPTERVALDGTAHLGWGWVPSLSDLDCCPFSTLKFSRCHQEGTCSLGQAQPGWRSTTHTQAHGHSPRVWSGHEQGLKSRGCAARGCIPEMLPHTGARGQWAEGQQGCVQGGGGAFSQSGFMPLSHWYRFHTVGVH